MLILYKRKQVESLKTELTALEMRNGKIQVALPKPSKAPSKKPESKKPESKEPAAKKVEDNKEQPKKDQKPKEQKPKQAKKPAAPAPVVDDKPIDVSRLCMKVGKITECVKHPGMSLLLSEAIN